MNAIFTGMRRSLLIVATQQQAVVLAEVGCAFECLAYEEDLKGEIPDRVVVLDPPANTLQEAWLAGITARVPGLVTYAYDVTRRGAARQLHDANNRAQVAASALMLRSVRYRRQAKKLHETGELAGLALLRAEEAAACHDLAIAALRGEPIKIEVTGSDRHLGDGPPSEAVGAM